MTNRKHIMLSVVVIFIVGLCVCISGCIDDSPYNPTISVQQSHLPVYSFDQRTSLQMYSYQDFVQNLDMYVGQPVMILAHIEEVHYDDNSNKCYGRLTLRWSDRYQPFFFYYNGDYRIVTGNNYKLYTEVYGFTTYQTVLGNSVTVPAVTVVDVERIY